MRMQSHHNLCGPAALANALRAVGVSASEDRVVAAMKRKATAVESPEQDGAGVLSLQKAAEAFRYTLVPWTIGPPEIAWGYLQVCVQMGRPCLLAVDSGQGDGHWVVAVGTLGEFMLIADAADAEIVIPVTREALLARWKDAENNGYYMLELQQAPRKRRTK